MADSHREGDTQQGGSDDADPEALKDHIEQAALAQRPEAIGRHRPRKDSVQQPLQHRTIQWRPRIRTPFQRSRLDASSLQPGDRFNPVGDPEAGQHMRHMLLHGGLGDIQLARDPLVGQAPKHHRQHLALPRGQP